MSATDMAKTIFAAVDVRVGAGVAFALLLIAIAALVLAKRRSSSNSLVSAPDGSSSAGEPSTLIEGPEDSSVGNTGPLLTLTAFGKTDIGGRENNEDVFLVKDEMFVVADGMGGYARGEEASRTVKEEFDKLSPTVGKSWFAQAVKAANDRMRQMKLAVKEREKFGTTVVAGRRRHNAMQYRWSGDSLLFRLRGGELTQLTEEHTVPVVLAKRGTIPWSDVPHHPWRNVLSRYIGGTSSPPEWEEGCFEMQAGDVYLFCSDGMTGYTELAKIKAILESGKSAEDMANDLIALALADKTRDNATVIVVVVS